MSATIANVPLSDLEHSAQLRKAVVAATVGTTIEWYDFFIYGTAAGLIFPQLFFPNQDPLTGTLAGVQHLFHRLHRAADRRRDLRPLRRPHRPQGDTDIHPAGDGHRHVPHRLRADLRVDRHLGRRHPDRAARPAGHRRRRRMGRLGADRDGMVARAQPAAAWSRRGRNSACRAACSCRTWRSSRSAPGPATDFVTWGWRIPFLLRSS